MPQVHTKIPWRSHSKYKLNEVFKLLQEFKLTLGEASLESCNTALFPKFRGEHEQLQEYHR